MRVDFSSRWPVTAKLLWKVVASTSTMEFELAREEERLTVLASVDIKLALMPSNYV